jgi:hypothetical protein
VQRVEISSASTRPAFSRPNGAWNTIRSYILWQHERGTLHYDIMVTLILIFVFFSPRFINFNDKPGSLNRHPTGVVVSSDGAGGLVYQIEASALTTGNGATTDGSATQEQLRHIIEPVSGDVSIVRYETVTDGKGRIREYRIWVKRK